jgi:hypothetical protein
MEKTKLEFQPASGDEVQKLIRDTANAPREVIDRTQAILRGR